MCYESKRKEGVLGEQLKRRGHTQKPVPSGMGPASRAGGARLAEAWTPLAAGREPQREAALQELESHGEAATSRDAATDRQEHSLSGAPSLQACTSASYW